MADKIFDMIAAGIAEGKGEGAVKKAKAVFQFSLPTAGDYTLDLKNGKGACTKGKAEKADVTFSMKDEDFMAMVDGKLNGQQAFMQGKLKLKGNMMLAQKLGPILDSFK